MPSKDKRIGIYGIYENDVLLYIGQTKYFGRRISQHKYDLKNRPYMLSIDSYLNKIDFNTISFKLLKECSVKDLDKYEEDLINLYKPKYNIHKGGKYHNFDGIDRSKSKRPTSIKVKCIELNLEFESLTQCDKYLHSLGFRVCIDYAMKHSKTSGGLHFEYI